MPQTLEYRPGREFDPVESKKQRDKNLADGVKESCRFTKTRK